MSMIGQFRELIGSWLQRDRIRVAPTTGRLLGLQVKDRFVLRGDAYVVQSREVDDVDSPTRVIYELNSSRGSCRLTVDVFQVHEVASGEVWDSSGCRLTVFDDDLAM